MALGQSQYSRAPLTVGLSHQLLIIDHWGIVKAE